jgi:sphingolipid delta-4 desaturase
VTVQEKRLDAPEFTRPTVQSGTPKLHAERRRRMLSRYPELERLYGPCPRTKYVCVALVAAELAAAYALRDASWWWLAVVAYLLGAVVNHALLLAIHELSHGLAFRKPWHNRVFAVFVNLPLGIPVSENFRYYHLLHHAYQGDTRRDVDLPTKFESRLLQSKLGRLLWLLGQALAYTVRPLLVHPKKPSAAELVQFAVQLAFNLALIHCWGAKAFAFLPLSSLLGMGPHPAAGHYVTEHHPFRAAQHTYSYYGPLNRITWNIGYHNEHHDFPYIPGSRLAKVRRLAPEFYARLLHHDSRVGTLWRFLRGRELRTQRAEPSHSAESPNPASALE